MRKMVRKKKLKKKDVRVSVYLHIYSHNLADITTFKCTILIQSLPNTLILTQQCLSIAFILVSRHSMFNMTMTGYTASLFRQPLFLLCIHRKHEMHIILFVNVG